MTPDSPQWIRVVVGRLHPLGFRVNAAQGLAVVADEILGSTFSWNLVFNKGADFFVAERVCKTGQKLLLNNLKRHS